MIPTKLTESFVAKLAFAGKPIVVRDTNVVGLMVVANRNSKSYKVQRDLYDAKKEPSGRRRLIKTVRRTLGRTDVMSLQEARTQAKEILAQIERGIDPNAPVGTAAAGVWTVARMYEEYIADMRKRGRAPRSIEDLQKRRDRYLTDWLPLPIGEVTRSMVRDRHASIAAEVVKRNRQRANPRANVDGAHAANAALGDFATCYAFALRVVDDPDSLPPNPCEAVTRFARAPQPIEGRALRPDELAAWWKAVGALPNPLRRVMHKFGLLSGLRPGTLVALRREWLRLDENKVCIPAEQMKSRRGFDLPLSGCMVGLLREALAIGDLLYPGTEHVFPTRDKDGRVVATVVWKEKAPALVARTGHRLRHTHRTIASMAGVDNVHAELLLDHRVPGVQGVYLHASAMFEALRQAQETITAFILKNASPARVQTQEP